MAPSCQRLFAAALIVAIITAVSAVSNIFSPTPVPHFRSPAPGISTGHGEETVKLRDSLVIENYSLSSNENWQAVLLFSGYHPLLLCCRKVLLDVIDWLLSLVYHTGREETTRLTKRSHHSFRRQQSRTWNPAWNQYHARAKEKKSLSRRARRRLSAQAKSGEGAVQTISDLAGTVDKKLSEFKKSRTASRLTAARHAGYKLEYILRRDVEINGDHPMTELRRQAEKEKLQRKKIHELVAQKRRIMYCSFLASLGMFTVCVNGWLCLFSLLFGAELLYKYHHSSPISNPCLICAVSLCIALLMLPLVVQPPILLLCCSAISAVVTLKLLYDIETNPGPTGRGRSQSQGRKKRTRSEELEAELAGAREQIKSLKQKVHEGGTREQKLIDEKRAIQDEKRRLENQASQKGDALGSYSVRNTSLKNDLETEKRGRKNSHERHEKEKAALEAEVLLQKRNNNLAHAYVDKVEEENKELKAQVQQKDKEIEELRDGDSGAGQNIVGTGVNVRGGNGHTITVTQGDQVSSPPTGKQARRKQAAENKTRAEETKKAKRANKTNPTSQDEKKKKSAPTDPERGTFVQIGKWIGVPRFGDEGVFEDWDWGVTPRKDIQDDEKFACPGCTDFQCITKWKEGWHFPPYLAYEWLLNHELVAAGSCGAKKHDTKEVRTSVSSAAELSLRKHYYQQLRASETSVLPERYGMYMKWLDDHGESQAQYKCTAKSGRKRGICAATGSCAWPWFSTKGVSASTFQPEEVAQVVHYLSRAQAKKNWIFHQKESNSPKITDIQNVILRAFQLELGQKLLDGENKKHNWKYLMVDETFIGRKKYRFRSGQKRVRISGWWFVTLNHVEPYVEEVNGDRVVRFKTVESVWVPVPNRKKATLHKLISLFADPEATVFTDEHQGYRGIGGKICKDHFAVCHKKKFVERCEITDPRRPGQKVRVTCGKVHSNNAETAHRHVKSFLKQIWGSFGGNHLIAAKVAFVSDVFTNSSNYRKQHLKTQHRMMRIYQVLRKWLPTLAGEYDPEEKVSNNDGLTFFGDATVTECANGKRRVRNGKPLDKVMSRKDYIRHCRGLPVRSTSEHTTKVLQEAKTTATTAEVNQGDRTTVLSKKTLGKSDKQGNKDKKKAEEKPTQEELKAEAQVLDKFPADWRKLDIRDLESFLRAGDEEGGALNDPAEGDDDGEVSILSFGDEEAYEYTTENPKVNPFDDDKDSYVGDASEEWKRVREAKEKWKEAVQAHPNDSSKWPEDYSDSGVTTEDFDTEINAVFPGLDALSDDIDDSDLLRADALEVDEEEANILDDAAEHAEGDELAVDDASNVDILQNHGETLDEAPSDEDEEEDEFDEEDEYDEDEEEDVYEDEEEDEDNEDEEPSEWEEFLDSQAACSPANNRSVSFKSERQIIPEPLSGSVILSGNGQGSYEASQVLPTPHVSRNLGSTYSLPTDSSAGKNSTIKSVGNSGVKSHSSLVSSAAKGLTQASPATHLELKVLTSRVELMTFLQDNENSESNMPAEFVQDLALMFLCDQTMWSHDDQPNIGFSSVRNILDRFSMCTIDVDAQGTYREYWRLQDSLQHRPSSRNNVFPRNKPLFIIVGHNPIKSKHFSLILVCAPDALADLKLRNGAEAVFPDFKTTLNTFRNKDPIPHGVPSRNM